MRFRISGICFLTLIFVFLISNVTFGKRTVVLIKGHVLNSKTNEPVSTTLNFIDPDGNKTPCKSNSNDGTYQTVLSAGTEYIVLMKDYLLTGNDNIRVPDSKEYAEFVYNFNAIKIETGLVLSTFSGFQANDSAFWGGSSKYILALKEFLFANPRASLTCRISSADSYFNTKTVKVEVPGKGKKKSFKSLKINGKEQLESLLKARIESFKGELSRIGIRPQRFEFITEVKEGKPVAVKTKSSSKKKKETPKVTNIPFNNVIISVGRMLDI